ncbi:hypothetical protein [Streptomyces sp. NPDC006645]|uniref:hypothetical protein n=1 Tax=unclassified Streptomyces TaxID=2593676 RepID=UPI00339F6382
MIRLADWTLGTDTEPGAPGPVHGCLHTLSIPSCFGFLAFIGLLFFLAAVHDLTQ